jgi:ketopantoate hydroxymethyltransferase
MSTPCTYWVQGPTRAQDGRMVYAVVRVLRDGRAMAVTECMTRELAQRVADELNEAVAA